MSEQNGIAAKKTRPNLSNYGVSSAEEGMLAWAWVDEQMSQARNYWVISTRPDGRPHAAPVWGVWVDGILYFSCARTAVKARNFAANPAVVVHLESGDDTVIFEGVVVENKADLALLTRIADAYAEKYPPFKPEPEQDPDNVQYFLKPKQVLAWHEKDYPTSATRWIFD